MIIPIITRCHILVTHNWSFVMFRLLALVAALAVTASPVRASVIQITPADLNGAALIDFGPTSTFAPINGQTINGVKFGYMIGGSPSNDAVIDGGPGNTNNITVANVVNTIGNANAVLSATFSTPETRLGYGFALLAVGNVPNATTVQLFDASNNSVGSLSTNASPDPAFPGGFLGVKSTIPFTRAEFTFSTAGQAFAFDNLRYQFVAADVPAPAPVPAPATLAVFAAVFGLGGLGLRRRKSA